MPNQSRSVGLRKRKALAASEYLRDVRPPPVIIKKLFFLATAFSIIFLNDFKNLRSNSSGTISEPPSEIIKRLLLGIGIWVNFYFLLRLRRTRSIFKTIIGPLR